MQLPVVPGSSLGIIVNPMSGRDIRRLVARASVFPNAEKTNMALRLISAAGALGVERVHMSTDAMGVAAGVLRAAAKRREREGRWPELEFCELAPTGTAEDTKTLVRRMRELGVRVLVVLGGDGTVRAAAVHSGDLPVLPLSTGTNNAFPEMWEATVAGTAAGLLATERISEAEATYRAKALRVNCADQVENALVDVCISTVAHVGARALWEIGPLRELYCAFAEPHAIGLSAIAGLAAPVGRTEANGVRVRLAGSEDATRRVLAPIAPGVLASVGLHDVAPLLPDSPVTSAVARGTVAVDGEREIEFGPSAPVTVTLTSTGPRVVDVRAALAAAAERHLLVSEFVLDAAPMNSYQEVR
ncbi:ATP-NAD kinase family protein [Pseudonocardia spinosispora]|uniref:ATP-NAD kinase family protein n=1 Tax=Pseudonocardia spinosispora TaxID=103441 RepID=UPI00042926EE|nr:NAD(+)/NADH kinase [Pseudonocardia spinosispora]